MQEQMQSSTAIPLQIQHLAETQHIGAFVARYPRCYKAYPLVWAIVVVFFTSMIGLVAPFTFLPWSYFLLFLALLGIVVYLLRVRAERLQQDDQVVVFAEGFIFLHRRIALAYRWENIEQILRGSPQSEGEGIADMDIMKVKATQGMLPFNIDSSWEKHDRASMCDRIERGFVYARLPQVLARYKIGEEIAFTTSPNDFLGVSTAGFRDSAELLPWPMLEKVEIGPELVIIKKEGRTSDWYHRLICTVPNAALLKALLDSIR